MKTWGKGGIDKFGSVTYESCRYTADYISKAQTQKDTYIDREPPFLIISKGMGRKYAEEYAEELLEGKGITHKGVSLTVPRYYYDVLKRNKEREERLKYIRKDILDSAERRTGERQRKVQGGIRASKLSNVFGGRLPTQVADAAKARRAKEAEIKAKIEMKDKGEL